MIKSTISEEKKAPSESTKYPCLQRSLITGRIVLFKEKNRGIELYRPPPYGKSALGAMPVWEEKNFEKFEGKLILENEK